MGLLRDSISQAVGANQINNGLNGPHLGFRKSPDLSQPSRPSGDAGYARPPPYYSNNCFPSADYTQQNHHSLESQWPGYRNEARPQSYRDRGFHVVALPQTSYEDGAPFLRGYSDSLAPYGISEQTFIKVIDDINVSIIPNPENQIFQKGANIAGWFVPGAASIGLMAGQVGVGLGAAVGHSSAVSRSLSNANLNIFLPNGLEICIGKAVNVDVEVGVAVSSQSSGPAFTSTPQARIAAYGAMLAPLSVVLPPASRSGRNDPIAMLGRGLGHREAQKKEEKAREKAEKGKNRGSSIDADLKWLIVRKATPNALEHWRRELQQSKSDLRQQ